MKKMFRYALSAALMAATLLVPSFAAEREAPAKQGDFHLLVNGAYVTFTDAAPQIVNDRSYLPFVAAFEQLGFTEQDMTWDAQTQTVTATKADTTIALTIGEKKIDLRKGEQTTTVDTDVAPYIDPALSRTYIPVGLVADALGYKVGWDGAQDTVIIDDLDAIFAKNDAEYTLVEKYMEYSKSFNQSNQSVKGNFVMGFDTLIGDKSENASAKIQAAGDYSMLLTPQGAFDFETKLKLDAEAKENGIADDDVLGIFPMDIDLMMRGDVAEGMFYYQSGALYALTGLSKDTWQQLDLAAMFDELGDVIGMDYKSLMSMSLNAQNLGFEEMLREMLQFMPIFSADLTSSDYLAQLNQIFADSAFVKSGSTYTSTFSESGVTISFGITTSGEKVTGYTVSVTASMDGLGEMTMKAGMKGNKMTMNMAFKMAQSLGEETIDVSMYMEMDGTYQQTSKKPVAAPPTGVNIVDMGAMMGI